MLEALITILILIAVLSLSIGVYQCYVRFIHWWRGDKMPGIDDVGGGRW